MRRELLGLALLAAFASSARAQFLYETHFDDDSGWTADPPLYGSQWKVDNRPHDVPAGPYRSEPSSLNLNDDTWHYEPSFFGEWAYSPYIDLAVANGTPKLSFWCLNELCENTCDNHEAVQIFIAGPGGGTVRCLTCANCYPNLGNVSPCTIGAWHEHTIALDRNWGLVQIRFKARGDGIANQCPGMFIDDMTIVDVPPTATYCTAKPNSLGCSATIATVGTPDLTSPAPFTISASQVLNQKNGLFFYGLSGPHTGPFLGGFLCVAQPVRRTTVSSSGGNSGVDDCSGVLAFQFNAWLQSGVDPALVPGVPVNGQFWYRDPADSYRTGLSNGVVFGVLP